MSDTFRSTAVVVCVNNSVNQIVHVIFNMPYKRATNSCQRPFLTNEKDVTMQRNGTWPELVARQYLKEKF